MEGIQNMSRRSFVKVFGLASGGLIIGCQFSSEKDIVRIDDGTTFAPNLFVQLKKDGKLILVCSRSEMGQGIRTSLTSAIADEMEVKEIYDPFSGYNRAMTSFNDGAYEYVFKPVATGYRK